VYVGKITFAIDLLYLFHYDTYVKCLFWWRKCFCIYVIVLNIVTV